MSTSWLTAARVTTSLGMRHAIGDFFQGRYEIRALLGQGSMAVVYRAFDHDTAHDVVLKLPHLAIAGDLLAFKSLSA